MNWAYRMFSTAMLVTSLSLMLTACGKKNNDDRPVPFQGNLSTDGFSSVVSNSTNNNNTQNFTVNEIARDRYASQNNGFGGYSQLQLLAPMNQLQWGRVSPIINVSNNVTTASNSKFITFKVTLNNESYVFKHYPRIGNSAQTLNSSGSYDMAGYRLDIDTVCDNANCENAFFNFLIYRDNASSNGNVGYRQIGIMKNMNNERIQSGLERFTYNLPEVYQQYKSEILFDYLFSVRTEQ